MKKILLLGGSPQQVIAIQKAKALGYYTVLCDYLPDNPGQFEADKFYLTSTTDKKAVLTIAIKEKINGVLAYASDPAAPTAAYIAEKLKLKTNPYKSVNILCNKDLLRSFLQDNGFDVPTSRMFENSFFDFSPRRFPVIIKPVDSSGSKGVTVLYSEDGLKEAIHNAFSFSRSKRIIIEEYLVRNHPYLIGGDIFIIDGEIKIWGLLNCHRDNKVNPLVPVGKSYPLELSAQHEKLVKETLTKIVKKLGIVFGAMNVELIISQDNRCFLIDAGPRAGGNMIPDLLGMIFNVDIVTMAIQLAMGEKVNCVPSITECYYATYNLHSRYNGIYKTILFDDAIDKYIIKKCLYKKEGDVIEYFDNASKALGIIFMKFNTKEEQSIISQIEDHIKIVFK